MFLLWSLVECFYLSYASLFFDMIETLDCIRFEPFHFCLVSLIVMEVKTCLLISFVDGSLCFFKILVTHVILTHMFISDGDVYVFIGALFIWFFSCAVDVVGSCLCGYVLIFLFINLQLLWFYTCVTLFLWLIF